MPELTRLTSTRRRATLALLLVPPLLGLSACATMLALRGEVSTFGEWPAGRAPGSFEFDRLPSQQAANPEQAQVEQAAGDALLAAGFSRAAPGQAPQYRVQIGVRVSQQRPSPWDDPMWWRFGVGGWRGHWRGGMGWSWSMPLAQPDYDREVALLIRDAATGMPLYEARARNSGATPGGESLIAGLFRLSLAEFPQVRPEPHPVVLPQP